MESGKLKRTAVSKVYLYTAIACIAMSFAVYGLLLLLPFIARNTAQKAMFVSGIVISGEVFQWLGILLIGKELIRRYSAYLNPLAWIRKWRNAADKTDGKKKDSEE
jgi:membrane-anchored protein YejM (alkaline phosphatase superfamily)